MLLNGNKMAEETDIILFKGNIGELREKTSRQFVYVPRDEYKAEAVTHFFTGMEPKDPWLRHNIPLRGAWDCYLTSEFGIHPLNLSEFYHWSNTTDFHISSPLGVNRKFFDSEEELPRSILVPLMRGYSPSTEERNNALGAFYERVFSKGYHGVVDFKTESYMEFTLEGPHWYKYTGERIEKISGLAVLDIDKPFFGEKILQGSRLKDLSKHLD